MPPNIDDAITYEVKREIAERYFGFRKLIEEDKLSLAEQIHQHTVILEKRISFELIRIYILLKEEPLIQAFLSLAGIEEELFYDPYLTESETIRQRVFQKIHFRGLTRKGRFKNAIVDCYERLCVHIDQYRENYADLVENREVISEEIRLFYKKNDLGSIMGFLRSLGDVDTVGHMQGGIETDIASDLEKKMHIPPPKPIEHFLPVIAPIAPLSAIKKPLKTIINQSFRSQKPDIHPLISGRTSLFKKSREK